MRLIGSSILVVLLITPLLFKSLTFADFVINNEFIAQNLCEKKQEAENTCQGKCYLKKQLSKVEGINAEEEQVPNTPNKSKGKSLEITPFISDLLFGNLSLTIKDELEFKEPNNFYELLLVKNTTPPPRTKMCM